MDNLTHSLIGAVVAEAAVRCVPVLKSTLPATTRRTLYFSLLVIGSNFPILICFTPASAVPGSTTCCITAGTHIR